MLTPVHPAGWLRRTCSSSGRTARTARWERLTGTFCSASCHWVQALWVRWGGAFRCCGVRTAACQRRPRRPAAGVQAQRITQGLSAVVESHCLTPACGSPSSSPPHVLNHLPPSRGRRLNLSPPYPFQGPGLQRRLGCPALLERRKRVRPETLEPGPLWTPVQGMLTTTKVCTG